MDSCGTCDASTLNNCQKDCSDTWGGTAYIDGCQICVSGNTGQTACLTEADCAGVLGGTSYSDNCGVCDDDSSNDCIQDCIGAWGGSAVLDNCGICGGNNTDCTDCLGVIGGIATVDNCGICDTDSSNDCEQDCAGTWGGTVTDCESDCSDPNTCSNCTDCEESCCPSYCSGNYYYYNRSCSNGFCVGATSDYCSNGCTENGCYGVVDCAGVVGGSAVEDCAGVCGGEDTSCEGCDGIQNSELVLDECGICGGNNSTCADCAGTPNGLAVVDNCGTCDSNLENDCTADCNGDYGGDKVVDNCGTCDNDTSNDCVQDCIGAWGGSAVLDNCGICGGNGTNCTVTDVDGNTYNTIEIGSQTWMKEDLKVTHYSNGDEIPSAQDLNWNNLTSGAYLNFSDFPDEAVYGKLYNWFTLDDSRGICPADWHVPSLTEWTILTNYLGGSSVAGGKMKETGTEHWQSPNGDATNESGFTALPGGYAAGWSNSYGGMWEKAHFWTATEDSLIELSDRHAKYLYLDYTHGSISFIRDLKQSGKSVRCLKD